MNNTIHYCHPMRNSVAMVVGDGSIRVAVVPVENLLLVPALVEQLSVDLTHEHQILGCAIVTLIRYYHYLNYCVLLMILQYLNAKNLSGLRAVWNILIEYLYNKDCMHDLPALIHTLRYKTVLRLVRHSIQLYNHSYYYCCQEHSKKLMILVHPLD